MRFITPLIITLLVASHASAQCGPQGCYPPPNRQFGIINRNQQESTIPTTPTLPGFPAAGTPTVFEDEGARAAIAEVSARINALDARIAQTEVVVNAIASDMNDAGLLKTEITDLGVIVKATKDRVDIAEGIANGAAGIASGAADKVKEVEKTLWGKTKTWLYSIIAVFTGGGLLTWLIVMVVAGVGWFMLRRQAMKVAQVVDKITDMIPGTLDDKLIDQRAYDLASRMSGQPVPTWAMQPNMTPWGSPVQNVWGNAPVQQPQVVQPTVPSPPTAG